MTDNRIEKIRAEIERRYNYHKDHADDYAGTEHFWKADEDRNLISFIDSMQKEPKFKTGDRIKPIDSCLGSPRTIVDVCDSWYVTDQGTLDFEFEDNWEATEELVKDDLNEKIKRYLYEVYDRINALIAITHIKKY